MGQLTGFGAQVWVVLAVVAGTGVLCLLHFMASSIRNVTYVHDMRVRVSNLRKDQAERLQALADAAEAAELAAQRAAPTRRAA
jgi:hypothetical protein